MAEVNSTFYTFPKLSMVRSWRERVPEEFEFAVRCHQDITHRYRFQPVEEAFRDWEYILRVCNELDAKILIIHIPPNFQMSENKIKDLNDFFSSVDLDGTRLAWELADQENTDRKVLVEFIREREFIHCVDLSIDGPAFEGEIAYSRLFGRSKYASHQFSDEELAEINQKAESMRTERIYLSYQGTKMYKDAARMKIYRQSGEFPPITRNRGLDSIIEVLREDIRLPATKKALIHNQGWKIFDLTEESRRRVSKVLEAIPDRPYHNFRELTMELRRLDLDTIFKE